MTLKSGAKYNCTDEKRNLVVSDDKFAVTLVNEFLQQRESRPRTGDASDAARCGQLDVQTGHVHCLNGLLHVITINTVINVITVIIIIINAIKVDLFDA